MMEEKQSGVGPANQPTDIDPAALLGADLRETSALLHNCAAIARDLDTAINWRMTAMTAAAQLARASVQIGKALAGSKPETAKPKASSVRRPFYARVNFRKTTTQEDECDEEAMEY